MDYGGIEFKHVWQFQIKIMLGNQYNRCINAKNQKDIIVACLRLGWNDAFRHTSKNVDGVEEKEKENIIVNVCEEIVDDFIEYAKKGSSKERHDYINGCLSKQNFKDKFGKIKVVTKNADKTLCFGHIQKMFNMAIKLFLCLKICAEQADVMSIDIKLNKSLFECDFAFDTADCPIDSIILKHINCEKSKWSKIGQDNDHPTKEYIKIQNVIAKKQENSNKSNLCFDFENWN